MDRHEVLTKICFYDERNPNNCIDSEWGIVGSKPCYCDNCFYGRTALAEELLKYLPEIEES